MTITDDLKAEAWAPESDLPLVLLTITHEALGEPLRLVNNRENITSNGQTYIAFPFEITLPDSNEDAPPRAMVRIDNVSREIGQAIRLMTSAAAVAIAVVRQEDPDTVEMEFTGMRNGGVQYDAMKVEFDLVFEDLAREPFPALTFSPAEFPGLIR